MSYGKRPANPASLKPLREVAFAMLGRSELTAAQLRTKLLRKGYEGADIGVLITELIERDYINDARAANLLVRRRAEGSKWGAGRIRQELTMKGVGKEMAAETLAAAEEAGHDWLATATALLISKFKAPLPPERAARQKELAKRLGFLQRRGFSGSQSSAALKATQNVADELDMA